MMNGDTSDAWYSRFSDNAARFVEQSSRVSKTHNYAHHRTGIDYVFEQVEDKTGYVMTGQGKGIQPGDCIILNQENHLERYRVQAIDYYASPPNMWIASLTKVE